MKDPKVCKYWWNFTYFFFSSWITFWLIVRFQQIKVFNKFIICNKWIRIQNCKSEILWKIFLIWKMKYYPQTDFLFPKTNHIYQKKVFLRESSLEPKSHCFLQIVSHFLRKEIPFFLSHSKRCFISDQLIYYYLITLHLLFISLRSRKLTEVFNSL